MKIFIIRLHRSIEQYDCKQNFFLYMECDISSPHHQWMQHKTKLSNIYLIIFKPFFSFTLRWIKYGAFFHDNFSFNKQQR